MPLLRVPEFRGAQVGAGVVVLTVLAVLLEARMPWSPGVFLACNAALGLLVWALVIGTPPAEGAARPWLAALCLSALALLGLTLGHLADVLGSDGTYGAEEDDIPHRALVISLLVLCLAATWCARRRGAASCALVAAIVGVAALLLAADWVADPSVQTMRWLLAFSAFVLLVLTIAQRDGNPEHAAQLANAGGLATAAIGQSAGIGPATLLFFLFFEEEPHLATGWQLLVLAAGFGLMAYGAVDGHRGPVVIGLVNIAIFVAAAALGDNDFVGWPLVLLLGGLAFLVIGLRPTTPAPPEPGSGEDLPPPIEVDVR